MYVSDGVTSISLMVHCDYLSDERSASLSKADYAVFKTIGRSFSITLVKIQEALSNFHLNFHLASIQVDIVHTFGFSKHWLVLGTVLHLVCGKMVHKNINVPVANTS